MQEQERSDGAGPSTDQMLRLVLTRLDRLPVERFVRMEEGLQHVRSLLEDEIENRKHLNVELDGLAKGLREMIDGRMEKALSECRQSQDLRICHLAERLEDVQARRRERRSSSLRVRIAVFGALSASLASLVNTVLYYLLRN